MIYISLAPRAELFNFLTLIFAIGQRNFLIFNSVSRLRKSENAHTD